MLGTARPGPANGQGDPYNSLVWRACRPLGAQMRDNVMGTSGSDAPLAARSSSIEWTRDPRSPVRKRPPFALARAWRCARHVSRGGAAVRYPLTRSWRQKERRAGGLGTCQLTSELELRLSASAPARSFANVVSSSSMVQGGLRLKEGPWLGKAHGQPAQTLGLAQAQDQPAQTRSQNMF